MSSALAEQALDIWLIQDAITASFRFRDFSSCVLVSKAWNRIFMPALWKVVQFGRGNSKMHETYLLSSDSVLLYRYSDLVQEITIQSYRPLLAGRESGSASGSDTGDIVPVFHNLRVLKWWPFQDRGQSAQDLQKKTMGMIRFMELHNTLEDTSLDQMVLNESIFERLCQVIDPHCRAHPAVYLGVSAIRR